MCITIEIKEDDLILVNGKEVRRDMDGKWGTMEEMEASETKAFHNFRKCLERCPKIHRAEYKL
jgi:hypothetical protein